MATTNEVLQAEAIRHQLELQRYNNHAVRKIIALLNRADVALIAQIQDAIGKGSSDWTVSHLEALLTQVRAINAEAYAVVSHTLTGELADFSAYEAAKQVLMLTKAIPADALVKLSINSVSGAQVHAAAMARPFQGRLLKEWMADLESGRAKKIRDAVRIGFTQGQTTEQIIRGIKGTRANNYADGLLERPRADLETVVRSAISHTAAYARNATAQANADIIASVKWLSTLDSHTTLQWCVPRDGLRYTLAHAPIGHSFPWLAGPGAIHWNAVVRGTMINTMRGGVPIEQVRVGDLARTHSGRYRPVLAVKRKQCEAGVVRVIQTQSGRTLRATDDHPVLTRATGWRFVGALEVGDELFHDAEELVEVSDVCSAVNTEPEYGPAVPDESCIALNRTIELVTADVDLDGDQDVWAREVDDRASSLVLRHPSVVESQSALHHLFALGDVLAKVGCNRLRGLLSAAVGNDTVSGLLADASVMPAGKIGRDDTLNDARHSGGIVPSHSRGVLGMHSGGFLSQTECPVVMAARLNNSSCCNVENGLLGFVANRDVMFLGEIGKASVGKSHLPLDAAEGLPGSDVLGKDDGAMVDAGFVHDPIVSLKVQQYSGMVYDLEVQGDESYVANGIVVSNCRSTSTFVLKSAEQMRLDGLKPGTRASLSGQVPADLTYAEWLKDQPAHVQDDVLGVMRARLYRKGKLPITRFTNNKGQLYTLDELRSRDAEAFKLAGL